MTLEKVFWTFSTATFSTFDLWCSFFVKLKSIPTRSDTVGVEASFCRKHLSFIQGFFYLVLCLFGGPRHKDIKVTHKHGYTKESQSNSQSQSTIQPIVWFLQCLLKTILHVSSSLSFGIILPYEAVHSGHRNTTVAPQNITAKQQTYKLYQALCNYTWKQIFHLDQITKRGRCKNVENVQVYT